MAGLVHLRAAFAFFDRRCADRVTAADLRETSGELLEMIIPKRYRDRHRNGRPVPRHRRIGNGWHGAVVVRLGGGADAADAPGRRAAAQPRRAAEPVRGRWRARRAQPAPG